MIFVEAPQGTPEWYAARCGKITASCFADAVSRVGGLDERQAKYVDAIKMGATQDEAKKEAGYKASPSSDIVRRALLGEETSEPSDTAKRYAADLAIERISGKPHGEPAKAWVLERGHEMETRARMLYEARTGAFITESGICLSDDGLFGYSSDGLADDDGLIEIKAPIDSIKIMDMWRTGDTSEYDHQIQGGLWLTARKWLDFIMYVPDLAAAGKDLFIKRIYRDDVFIDKMVEQLAEFDRLVEMNVIILRADTMPITTIEESAMTEIAPDAAPKNELAEAMAVIAAQPAADTRPVITIELEAVPEIPPIVQDAPPTLKLGDIADRLGFSLNAEFLASLGFMHTKTDKPGKLYQESDFPVICAALRRHIEEVQGKFQ